MYRNQHYWNRKQELAKKALAHHQAVTDTPDYMSAYTNNEVFSNYIPKNNRRPEQTPECSLWDTDSVTALFRLRKTYPDKRIAVLNFASYKEPGGRFLDGSSAQEESLCHQSTLYEALLKEINFYSWNNQHKNRSLYKNRAIYSRDIRFFDKDFLPANTTPADALAHSVLADVITCAAPNKYAAQKYCHVSDAENSDESRMLQRDRHPCPGSLRMRCLRTGPNRSCLHIQKPPASLRMPEGHLRNPGCQPSQSSGFR